VTGLRNLVLILALANLGVLAVFSWVIERPPPSPEYDGPGITLLRELDPDAPIARSVLAARQAAAPSSVSAARLPVDDESGNQASTPIDASSPPDANPPGNADSVVGEFAGVEQTVEQPLLADQDEVTGTELGRCISIGPFQEAANADAAMDTLVDAGFEPSRATREKEVWDGYWVYIEQIGDIATARSVQADLADNGIEDTQIVSTDSGNLLSLGVFSEITRAGSQAERVNQVGYEATIADNLTTTETLWLDVTLTSEQSLALDMLQAPGRISRLEFQPCLVDEDG
jgi:hypothetical protein